MSCYFFGVCHDCRVIAEVSNVDTEQAEKNVHVWAHDRGHEEHCYDLVSEYDSQYEDGCYTKYERKDDWY